MIDNIKNIKILVVEDSQVMRGLIIAHLEDIPKQNFHITSASNGREAICLFKEEQPDVVLLDYMLPDMNGMDIIEELSQTEPVLPILMITRYDDIQLALDAIHAGAQGYLLKDRMSANTLLWALEDLQKKVVIQKEILSYKENLEELVKKQVNEISQAKEKAEEANQLKSEFLSNMSHELRTPMHVILNLARMCLEGLNTGCLEENKEHLQDILLSGERLLKLLNNLLDLAKLESRDIDFYLESFSVRGILERCVNEVQALSKEKTIDITINSDNDDGSEIYINADRSKLEQVIMNLLSNAIKFSPDESTIKINCYIKDGCNYIQVQDEGPGVPEEEKANIFDKFVQSSFTKRGSGGTGLGLSICKEIINKHNGEIWVENNTEAGGAVFKLKIPQKQTTQLMSN